MQTNHSNNDPYVQVSLDLKHSTVSWLDDVRETLGLRNQSAVVRKLLDLLEKETLKPGN